MQERFVGDIGDFSKFSLVEALSKEFSSFGLVSYMTPNERKVTERKRESFVFLPEYRKLDAALVQQLEAVLQADKPSMALLHKSLGLGAKDIFFTELLDQYLRFPASTAEHKAERLLARKVWLVRALKAVEDCSLVCLDPDSGFEAPSVANMASKKAHKHAYFTEVEEFCQNAEVVMVYDFFDRASSHRQQMKEKLETIKTKLRPKGKVFALRFRPISPCAYYLIASPKAAPKVEKVLEQLTESDWSFCWDLLIKG